VAGRNRSTSPSIELTVGDRVVRVSNPDRVYFPESGAPKFDLVRFPKGLAGDKVHQKRLPHGAPDWVGTVRLHFPRYNRTPIVLRQNPKREEHQRLSGIRQN
jgi:DNA primase